jgi:hypothetical protein
MQIFFDPVDTGSPCYGEKRIDFVQRKQRCSGLEIEASFDT